MTVSSADYTEVVDACRRVISVGGNLSGAEVRKVIDVVQDATRVMSDLSDEVTAQLAIWDAAKGADSSTEYAAAESALTALQADVVAAITPVDITDGRP